MIKFKIDRLGGTKQRRFSFNKVGYCFGVNDDDDYYTWSYKTYGGKHNAKITTSVARLFTKLCQMNIITDNICGNILDKETIID